MWCLPRTPTRSSDRGLRIHAPHLPLSAPATGVRATGRCRSHATACSPPMAGATAPRICPGCGRGQHQATWHGGSGGGRLQVLMVISRPAGTGTSGTGLLPGRYWNAGLGDHPPPGRRTSRPARTIATAPIPAGRRRRCRRRRCRQCRRWVAPSLDRAYGTGTTRPGPPGART